MRLLNRNAPDVRHGAARRRLTLIAVISLFTVVGCARKPTITPETLAQSIRQALPVGSTPSAVLAWCDARHIEHSEYLQDRREINAILRHPDGHALVHQSIAMQFTFDEHDRLAASDVKPIYTGP